MNLRTGPLGVKRVKRIVVGLLAFAFIAAYSPMAIAEDSDDSVTSSNFDTSSLIDLQACLSRDNAILDVYFLIDNSRSMNQIGGNTGAGTDPDGLRFKAVQSSLVPLIDLAGQGTTVNVAGGLFSKEGRTVVDWIKIDPENKGSIADISESLSQEAGGGTNWVAGLREAQTQLRRQQSQPGLHCQALVWVTDGGIDIEQNLELTAAGVTELCGVSPVDIGANEVPSGLMYDIRNSGIIVLGVLIQQAPGSGDELGKNPQLIRDSKVSYFGPVVTGTGSVDAYYFNGEVPLAGEFNCGAIVPGAQGQVLQIQEAEELRATFQELASCIADSCTQLPPTAVACDGVKCEIAIPKGIASMQLTVPADFQLDRVTAPNGSGACLPGTCSLPEDIIETGTVRILVNNQAGIWTVATDAQTLNPLLFSGLEITTNPIEVDPLLRKISVDVRLGQGENVQFNAENYDSLIMDAFVRFSNGVTEAASIKPSLEGWALTWEPSDSTPEGIAPTEVVISLAATAAGDGASVPSLKLARIEQPFPVTLKNLEQYPTIIQPLNDEILIFSAIEGRAGVGVGDVVVKGPLTNDGAICWDTDGDGFVGTYSDSQSEVPRKLTAQLGSGASETITCQSGQPGILVPQNSEIVVPIELLASDQADGLFTGTIDVSLYGPAGEPGFPRELNFSVETTVVKSGLAFGIVFAILTLLGVGIPYVALVVFARRQAAFSSQLDGTRWSSLAATVGPEGLLSLEERDPSRYEFIFVDKKGLTRAIETGNGRHEVIPPTFWPFKAAKTIVKSQEGPSIFTNHDAVLEAGREIGESSQALGNVFYFVASPKTVSNEFAEAGSDDWGNLVSHSSDTSAVQTDAPISGKVVLLAPGNIDAAEAISKATADVRTWYGWANVYSAMTTGEVVTPASAIPSKGARVAGNDQPESGAPAGSGSVIEDEWGFGTVSAPGDNLSAEKKSRFGKKKKKSDGSGSNQQPPSDFDFNSSDW